MKFNLTKKSNGWFLLPDSAREEYAKVRSDVFEDILFPNLSYDLTIKNDELYLLSAYDEKNKAHIEEFDLEKIAFHLGIRVSNT